MLPCVHSLIVSWGLSGVLLCSAYIRSCTAWYVASIKDICGILNLLGRILLCLILFPLLPWGFMLYETCSDPFLVLCISRLLHLDPTMLDHLVYYELLILYQVGLRVCGWNKIIRRCEYRLICEEGLLICMSRFRMIVAKCKSISNNWRWESLYTLHSPTMK